MIQNTSSSTNCNSSDNNNKIMLSCSSSSVEEQQQQSRCSKKVVRFDTENIVKHDLPAQHSRLLLKQDTASTYWYNRAEIDTIERECRNELKAIMNSSNVGTSSSSCATGSSHVLEFFSSLRGMEPPKDAKKAKQVIRSVVYSQNCIDCIPYTLFVKECVKRAISLAYIDQVVAQQDYLITTTNTKTTSDSSLCTTTCRVAKNTQEERSSPNSRRRKMMIMMNRKSRSLPAKLLLCEEEEEEQQKSESGSVEELRRRPNSFSQRSRCKKVSPSSSSSTTTTTSSSSSSVSPTRSPRKFSLNKKKLSLKTFKKQKNKVPWMLSSSSSRKQRLSQ